MQRNVTETIYLETSRASYMERKYLALLLAVGIAADLYAAITYQWILAVIIVAAVALILVASDAVGQAGV